uniref:Cyclin C n=1 Tax=Eptatretus burgeri TaxID=7764 RepID=A0A8C4QT39_EPTBU
MAGNFWQSSHFHQWILDKQDIIKERQKDLKNLSEDDYWKIQIFFANVIQALGEQLKLRQQVIATATVYFKRFYARYSLHCIDPVLMAPTCIFLASKVEDISKGCGQIQTKLGGQVGCVRRTNSIDFGEELNAHLAYQWDTKCKLQSRGGMRSTECCCCFQI